MQTILAIVSVLCVFLFLKMVDYKCDYDLQVLLNRAYLKRIAYLENTLRMKQREKYDINYNKDVLDAIKVAMKASHPDNGRRSEDFIKYRDLYNKMKK